MLTTAMIIHSVQSKTQIKNTQGMEKGKKSNGKVNYTYFQCCQTGCRKAPPSVSHLSSQGHATPMLCHSQHALARWWMLALQHQINDSIE
jgi:hypothetical protein